MPFALSLYAGIVVPSLLSVPQPIEFFLEVAPAYPSGNGEKAFFLQLLVHLPHQLVGVGLEMPSSLATSSALTNSSFSMVSTSLF